MMLQCTCAVGAVNGCAPREALANRWRAADYESRTHALFPLKVQSNQPLTVVAPIPIHCGRDVLQIATPNKSADRLSGISRVLRAVQALFRDPPAPDGKRSKSRSAATNIQGQRAPCRMARYCAVGAICSGPDRVCPLSAAGAWRGCGFSTCGLWAWLAASAEAAVSRNCSVPGGSEPMMLTDGIEDEDGRNSLPNGCLVAGSGREGSAGEETEAAAAPVGRSPLAAQSAMCIFT